MGVAYLAGWSRVLERKFRTFWSVGARTCGLGLVLAWTPMAYHAAAQAAMHEAAGDAAGAGTHHLTVSGTTRSTATYDVPNVRLVRDDDQTVSLPSELDDGRPVVLSFVYTTCTTLCPLTSQTLSDLQSKLGAAQDAVHLVSISIDPEQDTPARLREYARKFGAGPQWQHYTGTLAASLAIQRAFAVYYGDKMSHRPVTLVRLSKDSPWIRIEGFASAQQLLAELHPVVAAQ